MVLKDKWFVCLIQWRALLYRFFVRLFVYTYTLLKFSLQSFLSHSFFILCTTIFCRCILEFFVSPISICFKESTPPINDPDIDSSRSNTSTAVIWCQVFQGKLRHTTSATVIGLLHVSTNDSILYTMHAMRCKTNYIFDIPLLFIYICIYIHTGL